MVAARHQDQQELADVYRDTEEVVLTIDGLQPEKGHETLYDLAFPLQNSSRFLLQNILNSDNGKAKNTVVRELNANRVWFAEPLLSGATDEIRKLFVRAREIAKFFAFPIRIQDKFNKRAA